MSKAIRQTHRWVSILFTLTVAANFTAMAVVSPVPMWVNLTPLPFLFVLLFSGLYMFALPYLRGARRT